MAALAAEATAAPGSVGLDSHDAENENDTLVSEPDERGTPRAALADALLSEDVERCRQLLAAHRELVNAGLRSRVHDRVSGFSDSSFLQYVDAPPSRQLDWEKTVRLLVDAGADLAVSDRLDLGSAGAGSASLTYTPLGYASCWGSADIVRYLASKGSDIHQQRSYPKDRCFLYGVGGDKTTPLHRGAHHWNADGVRALLELGGDPDATDEYGRQPLHWAAIGRCLSRDSLGLT